MLVVQPVSSPLFVTVRRASVMAVIGAVSLLLASKPGYSAVTPGAPCPSLSSAKDVLVCALEQHPSVRKASAALRQAELLEGVAAQRPNPELDTTLGAGESLGDTSVSTDTTLAFTIELGGKRSARKSRAFADRAKSLAELQAAKEAVAVDTAESLHRLRQVVAEKLLLDEALSTFQKTIGFLKARRHRSAEQDVSLVVYDTARSEYLLRQSSLLAEEKALEQKLSLAIGVPFAGKARLLPLSPNPWPELKTKPGRLANSSWKRAEADLQVAESEYELARGESWPNLKVGPNFQTDTQGALTVQTYGVMVSLPLPIFNANGAGRAYARKGIDYAETALEVTGTELQTEYDLAHIHYTSAVGALRRVKSRAELEQAHRHIESLIERGLVQSSLVIEAHRQLFDFTKSFHEQELAAIRSLWRVYQIEGRVLGEAL